jgi:putative tricarboxylic transport membrane protein
MIEISTLVCLFAGIIIGVMTGLLPSMPMAVGMMLLFPFVDHITVLDIFVYWTAIIVGAQFFGSVATISTGIPGEASSLIYVNDIKNLAVADRTRLILYTAVGSWIASVSASVVGAVVFYLGSYEFLFWFNKIWVKATIFAIALGIFLYFSRHRIITLCLIFLGLVLSPKNNYALPDVWFHLQSVFENTTFFVIAIGLLIVPELFNRNTIEVGKKEHQTETITNGMPWFSAMKGSVVGALGGLIPGPSAVISATMAYASEKDIKKRITSAESANNSAMITSMFPLLVIGIPITITEVIVLQMLESRSINWPDLSDLENLGKTLIYVQMIAVALATAYFILSTRMIGFYAQLLMLLQSRLRIILLCLIVLLAGIDFYYSEISILNYLLLLTFFSAIGKILLIKKIDPIPLLFAFVVGDRVIWTGLQLLAKFG